MRRLFYILLFSLLLSLFLSLLVMFVTFRIGYIRSSRVWGNQRGKLLEERIEEAIRDALAGGSAEAVPLLGESLDRILPPGATLIVYNDKKRVVYSHMGGMPHMRGSGHRKMMQNRDPELLPQKPVRVRGRTVGYYSLGAFGFGADRATSQFLESMRRTILFSIVSAVVIAVFFSLFVSKRLSKSAKTVSDGIDEMAQLPTEPFAVVPFCGLIKDRWDIGEQSHPVRQLCQDGAVFPGISLGLDHRLAELEKNLGKTEAP